MRTSWCSNRKMGGRMTGNALQEYLVDATQRTILFWDVLRERGNQFNKQAEKTEPNVLSYDYELVMSGADLSRPVNYGLIRIKPPMGIKIDNDKRPFVIIDPRAGHGPGIGGFKADSELGVAMAAGHPCYLIGFTPEPMPGQTIEDVMKAEVAFIEHVISLHPKATCKPAVIGNCQGGWALMMLASYRPDLCGPILLAGSPMSYWAGVHGKNPMRYSGGLLGGTWLTALTGDMGAGKFDGAWLVSNFEGMNPANTYWSKQYNVYKEIDSETDRYLGFEKYWSGYVFLNAEEMQFIVDKLFVGNKLPTAEVETSDGVRLDFRNVRSPIICFCSEGDNITPPQQALGWILDLYDDVEDIRACGQTIVYAVHPSIGHLGIFVSGGIAKKEHNEFASNIDFIDCLPPGLYEAVMTEKSGEEPDAEFAASDYISRFETRTLDDIRALGTNSEDDERSFAAVARLSEINKGFYRALAQPFVRSMMTPQLADALSRMHPARVTYQMFSDENPLMGAVRSAAEKTREQRKPAASDNPFWLWQEQMSNVIEATLDSYRDTRDGMIEAWFHATFSNPLLRAAVGLEPDAEPRTRPGQTPEHRELVSRKSEELKNRMDEGGVREACIRSILYVRMPEGAADERRFQVLQRLRDGEPGDLEEFKSLVREQFLMLTLDEEAAVDALPKLLTGNQDQIERALDAVRLIANTGSKAAGDVAKRLKRVEAIFNNAIAQTQGKVTKINKPKSARKV